MNCNAVQTWDQRLKISRVGKQNIFELSLAWLHLEMNTAWVIDGTGARKADSLIRS